MSRSSRFLINKTLKNRYIRFKTYIKTIKDNILRYKKGSIKEEIRERESKEV